MDKQNIGLTDAFIEVINDFPEVESFNNDTGENPHMIITVKPGTTLLGIQTLLAKMREREHDPYEIYFKFSGQEHEFSYYKYGYSLNLEAGDEAFKKELHVIQKADMALNIRGRRIYSDSIKKLPESSQGLISKVTELVQSIIKDYPGMTFEDFLVRISWLPQQSWTAILEKNPTWKPIIELKAAIIKT